MPAFQLSMGVILSAEHEAAQRTRVQSKDPYSARVRWICGETLRSYSLPV